ncbi:PqqD family protein [Dyadobacter sp. CY312]|uniref:PqqD family protein n=1 Tax=Dyadobacter sp. CY312 TaxID=2907303 RepID=UPI001F459998|nr:PqqD family protein [Dyadobacter sp. CY312]MCE7039821.1 PqqD family peptide modification chaperone [Dyadobacter sp. CY312]
MKYKLTSEQIASKVAGETVILNHNKGAYYGLDEVGVLVWDSLEKGPQTIDELCAAVLAEYDVEEAECKSDVDDLLKDLISERLVEITE